eukprot:15156-Heterococcus_DN1.PRE.1
MKLCATCVKVDLSELCRIYVMYTLLMELTMLSRTFTSSKSSPLPSGCIRDNLVGLKLAVVVLLGEVEDSPIACDFFR